MYLFFIQKNKTEFQAVYHSTNALKRKEELASFFKLMYLFFMQKNKTDFQTVYHSTSALKRKED